MRYAMMLSWPFCNRQQGVANPDLKVDGWMIHQIHRWMIFSMFKITLRDLELEFRVSYVVCHIVYALYIVFFLFLLLPMVFRSKSKM